MTDTSHQVAGIKIAAVVATKNRCAELANRSLRSIIEQTRSPDYLVVVDDSDRRDRATNRRIVATLDIPGTRVTYRENDRTPGASGAWNVALDFLHRHIKEPDNIFVAILDDDDRWAPAYLEECEKTVLERNLDMVAADILRFEQSDSVPLLNSAPDCLCAADFLVGNPGIQGSNLFLRLSVLLAAGLFDEGLKSTTDRDLCIRIADLGDIRYEHLNFPLVEHFADEGRARLTRRGSISKIDGLTAFWHKYSCRMSTAQQESFKDRADRLFGWSMSNNPQEIKVINSTPISAPTSETCVALVVAIIVDVNSPGDFYNLVQDLLHLQEDNRLVGLDVVILENGECSGNACFINEVTQTFRNAGIGCYVVPLERQIEDARAGLFGWPFERERGIATIAIARTMLQTYTYIVAKARTGAIVWVLDDDCRLDNLVWDGQQLMHRPSDIIGTLVRLREAKIDIAIGTVTDAPPLPFASCIRTQLVDAYHNFESMASLHPDSLWPNRLEANMEMRKRCEDFYYDLSRRDTDHLEMPFWYIPKTEGSSVREAFKEMVARLPRILAGEQVFRQLILDTRQDPLSLMQPSIHRGGNTFVFDVEALRDYPNAAPHVCNTETRRSDMIWSLLNRYIAHRSIVKLPLAVRQNRQMQPIVSLDLKKLARDIQGYALYSAMEDVLLELHEGVRWDADESLHGLNDIEASHLKQKMQKFLRERVAAFSLSFHRAAGLVTLLGRYVSESTDNAPWWLLDDSCIDSVEELRRLLKVLKGEFDLTRLRDFEREVCAIGPDVVTRFLDQLKIDMDARTRADNVMHDVERWVQQQRISNAEQKIKENYGIKHCRLLGFGSEAVVLTDERFVYKVLDYWKTRMPRSQLDFLRDQVGKWNGVRSLYPLHEVRSIGASVVIVYEYESSIPFHGGCSTGLVRLLQDCRRVGIVCNNVHPDNLVVTTTGVKLIDYGADIKPFSEEGFEHMARRAFLSCRHAGRTDLKEVMRQALENQNLPELSGFALFREALEPASKEMLLDQNIANQLGKGHGRTVLDYGCGKGKLAETLASLGWNVTAYDPGPALSDRWQWMNCQIEFGNHSLLMKLRKDRKTFDIVICCLVLCLLEEEDLREVLADLRRFSKEDTLLIVTVCNPRFVHGTTQLQQRITPAGMDASDVFQLEKHIFSTNARIVDMHRPMQLYIDLFDQYGLKVQSIAETAAVDLETFERSSDFMIFQLRQANEKEMVDDAQF